MKVPAIVLAVILAFLGLGLLWAEAQPGDSGAGYLVMGYAVLFTYFGLPTFALSTLIGGLSGGNWKKAALISASVALLIPFAVFFLAIMRAG